MEVTIHQNVIMEFYGKTITGLGPKELVKWLLWGMLQLLWDYFGPKLCIFYTIFSMIRVHMQQKCLTFFKNNPFVWKTFRKGGRVGVLVTALSGLGRKTLMAFRRRKRLDRWPKYTGFPSWLIARLLMC